MTKYRRKFHRIARKLTNLELQTGSTDFSFSMEGVLDDLQQSHGSDWFLGFYSEEGILRAFEKFGICRELQKRGFKDIIPVVDVSNTYRQMVRVYNKSEDSDHLLGEIVVRKARFAPKSETLIPEKFYPLRMIQVEWMVLQDQTKDFSKKRPRLPGQEHPGLGIGPQILELLYIMSKHQETQGLLIVPHYYHTALIFSREFRFLNPRYQGLLNAIDRDLGNYKLPLRAWAVELGAVKYQSTGTPFVWDPEEQILACDRKLREYLNSKEYQKRTDEAAQEFAFRLDQSVLHRKLPQDVQIDIPSQ